MTITNILEQKSIESELSVCEIFRVTISRNALDNEAATAISAEMPIVVGSGRRITSTPMNPIPIVSQRVVLTCSLRKIGANAAMKIGLEKTIVTIWASGNNDKPVTMRSVVERKRTARRS